MSSIASFFSSLLPTIQADTAADEKPADENNSGTDSESSEEAPAEQEEEEEEEPEDLHPAIREECRSSTKCAPLAQHFERCNEKVQAGEGFKGEDCVEEMFHMMHCVEDCAAPKLFVKLK